MRSLAIDILRVLTADGPGTVRALGAACRARPAEVERRLARLADSGWIARAGDVVRLREPFDFLDAARIAAGLGERARELDVRVLDTCPSTNTALLAEVGAAGTAAARGALLLAEEQTAGRGRRGRRWLSCVGTGLALSIARRMVCEPGTLATLSLAAGVACVRALRDLGATDVALKWPNDLLVGGAKLGGILAETRIRRAELGAVIGVGLNCRMAPGLEVRLGRRVASLRDCLSPLPPRNVIAARIAAELFDVLDLFEAQGDGAFARGFKSDWETLDAYRGQRLRVRLADGRIVAGIADGLAEDGGLRLRTRAGVRAIRGGRVVQARVA